MPAKGKRKAPKVEPASQADLGQAIRELRAKAGITQAELASKIGHSESYLSELENGKRNPTWAVLGELAQGLNVKISTIVEGAEDLK